MATAGSKRWIFALVAAVGIAVVLAMLLVTDSEPAPLGFGEVLYYHSKGEVRARVSVTNLSEVNLLLFDGRGWARVEGPQGWATNRLGQRWQMESVKPGSNFMETLPILPGTTRWQIGYFVPTRSPREKTRLAAGWRRQVFVLMEPMISDRKPPAKEFWSEVFEVPVEVNRGRTND